VYRYDTKLVDDGTGGGEEGRCVRTLFDYGSALAYSNLVYELQLFDVSFPGP
jgi:hypothetical protein